MSCCSALFARVASPLLIINGPLRMQQQYSRRILLAACGLVACLATFAFGSLPSVTNSLNSTTRLIHIFWKPGCTSVTQPGNHAKRRVEVGAQHLNRKIEAAFRSALRTQTDAHIILWTHPNYIETMNLQTRALQELRCRSAATMEVRSTEELTKMSAASGNPLMRKCVRNLSGQLGHKIAYSDLLRFVALYFFGGLYVDADTMFLRDMRDLHGQSFAFKWDFSVTYYNTAIMGLPKGSPLVPQIIENAKECSAKAFYPTTIHNYLNCTIGVCRGLKMMPSALFNPSQASQTNWHWQSNSGIGHDRDVGTDWFFDRPRLWDLDHFFPGAYTFHWHNRWMHPVHNESFFADLERLNSECTSQSAPISLLASGALNEATARILAAPSHAAPPQAKAPPYAPLAAFPVSAAAPPPTKIP